MVLGVGGMYEVKLVLRQRGVVISSRQVEYRPRWSDGVVLYDFGFMVLRLRDDGVLIFDEDKMLQDKDVFIDGRKVASGVKIEGIFVHTGLKPKPVLDEEDLLNLINQRTPTMSPEGELYKKVGNLYIELVDGKPKLRVEFENE